MLFESGRKEGWLQKLISKFTRSTDCKPLEAALDIVSNAPALQAASTLAELVLQMNHPLLEQCERKFIQALDSIPSEQWPRLDELVSHLTHGHGETFDRTILWEHPALHAIHFCHHSGHVREQAVRSPDQLPVRIALELLFIRYNEWVENVCEAAKPKIEALLPRLKEAEKAAIAISLIRLGSRPRHKHRWGHQRLNGDSVATWLEAVVSTLDARTWAVSWKNSTSDDRKLHLKILEIQGATAPEIRHLLLASNNQAAIFCYIRHIFPKLPPVDQHADLSSLTKCRIPAIRREKLMLDLAFLPPDDRIAHLEGYLFDKSSSMRNFARFHLQKLTPFDFTQCYHAALSDPVREPLALAGLREIYDERADKEALERIHSPNPLVRKAAIFAVSEDKLDSLMAFLIDSLDDPNPGIVKAARKRLAEIPLLLGIHLVKHPELLDKRSAQAHRHIIKMAPNFQKWDALDFLFQHMKGRQNREHAEDGLRRWLATNDRRYTRLWEQRKSKLLNLLSAIQPPPQSKNLLEFIITKAE